MGSSGGSKYEKRFAPYIEARHNTFLGTIAHHRAEAIALSPYSDYSRDPIEEDFFGVGYIISSFASLYDMFGKFMAGLDIESAWTDSVKSVLSVGEVQENIRERTRELDDRVELEIKPVFQQTLRNINAVNSSSFIVGNSMIDDRRVKDASNICIEETSKLIPTATSKVSDHLSWNQNVVTKYALLMKEYYAGRMGTDHASYQKVTEDTLWPFYVLEHERNALNALGKNTQVAKQRRERSTISKVLLVLSWTANGASIGFMIGGYPGAIVGAVVGFVAGVAMLFLE